MVFTPQIIRFGIRISSLIAFHIVRFFIWEPLGTHWPLAWPSPQKWHRRTRAWCTYYKPTITFASCLSDASIWAFICLQFNKSELMTKISIGCEREHSWGHQGIKPSNLWRFSDPLGWYVKIFTLKKDC